MKGNMTTLPKALYTAAQTRELDRLAIAAGTPGAELMSRAGQAAFDTLCERWPEARRIAVLCGGGNNSTGFCDPIYDDMIQKQAPTAKTREQRYAIFKDAETRLMEQMPIIPIYTYTSNHLIQPSVKGMPPNLMDSVNFRYVSLENEPEVIE